MKTSPLRWSILLAAGLVAVVAGCSSGKSDADSLPSINVLTQVAGQLDAVGIPADPGSLACDGELAAKAGESVRCEFVTEGQPVDLVASVASVKGTDVAIKIKTEARPVPKANLEEQVRLRIEREMNSSLTSAVCKGDLDAEVDATTTCTLTDDSSTREVKVTTSALDGGLVEFTISDA